jgi:predicted RNA-binding protein with PIN domain
MHSTDFCITMDRALEQRKPRPAKKCHRPMTVDSFLEQTYAQVWHDYNTVVTSDSAIQWDYVVITASNSEQAQAFSNQIESRRSAALLPTI